MAKRKTKLKVRHWFLPHQLNDHRPHLIRAHGLAIVALLVIGVQGAALALRPPEVKLAQGGHVLAYASDINPVDLLAQTNQQRAAAGLPALHLDSRLNNSAGLKAEDMFSEDYWAHTSPSGIEPWYWFGKAGYAYSYAGENLAKDFDTTSGTMTGWMNSPGHRANILNPHYVDVGFAVVNGVLLGGETTLVVAHYGAPGITVAAAPPAPAAPAKPEAPAKTGVQSAVAPAPSAPAPTPTPPPPTPTPKHAAAATAPDGSAALPSSNTAAEFLPFRAVKSLNLATLVTLLILLGLLCVYGYTQLTVWRKGLERWGSRRYKLFAALQVSTLVALIVFVAGSGIGTVG
jgi:hypothetical protein